MKRKIVFLLFLFCVVIIFQSCGTEIDDIAKNYPRIDGSTSSLPIVQEIYKAIFKPEIIDGEKVWNGLPQTASKTIESYKLLIDGEVDLIIVPDPSEEVKTLAAEKGVELEYIPICLEALVFITHKDTTVNNLTTEEIKSIYIDMQIDNWSQLGGNNNQIFAICRNEDSGSHALMEKFVLKGEKVNEQIRFNAMSLTMFGIVDEIENYVNFSGRGHLPLGYTIYYFFQNNKEEQKWNNVKMLNIDGVEPNDETIASGEYPYSTNYYAVIKKDTPKDSTSRKLISWLLSDKGQKIFTNAGFGIIK